MSEILEVCAATDEIIQSNATIQKSNKELLTTLNEVNKRVKETIGDLGNVERKIVAENSDLSIQLEQLENKAIFLADYKDQLQCQLEEARHSADNEAKERKKLFEKLLNLENQVNGAKEHLDKETGVNKDILKKVAKARQESQMWKRKYEKWK